jgi:Dolichyl-phosphate-mannose-protein mannosyltransferase
MQPPNRDLKITAALLAAGLVVLHLGLALTGHAMMREQHLGTAVDFARHGIDLLHPMLLGANANGVPVIMEFPIWQAATALLMKAFGVWYGWGNVVSLICHLSSLWPLYRLARRFLTERAAWWALALYLAQPISLVYGGMAGVDAMSAAAMIWFIHLGAVLLDTGEWKRWPLAVLAGLVSVTIKLPFFMTAGLVLFFLLWQRHRSSKRAWLQLASVGFVATVAFLVWNRHCQHYYELAEFAFYDLRLGGRSSYAYGWWFGRWEELLRPSYVLRAAWHLAVVFFGGIALLILPVIGWFVAETRFLRWWLLAGMVTTLIFTNVVLVHFHYHFIFAAPLIFLAARAVQEMEMPIRRMLPDRVALRVALLLFFFGACVAQGLVSLHLRLLTDNYVARQAAILQQHTAPTDKLIVWGQEWGSPFMHAERSGVSMLNIGWLDEPAKLARLKELGYSHFVLINRSPIEVATATVTGGANVRMAELPKILPEVAKSWPVVLDTPAMLILRIP